MTYEEKKKHLEKYNILDAHIDVLIEEKRKWYDRALAVSTPECGKNATEAIKKVVALEKEIDCSIDRLIDLRNEITEAIERVDDYILRQVLYMKYINGMTFESIGANLLYCERQINRLHKKAVEKLDI